MATDSHYEPLLENRESEDSFSSSQESQDTVDAEKQAHRRHNDARTQRPRWRRRPEPWSYLLTVLFIVSNAMWLVIALSLFFVASHSLPSPAEPRFATDLADAQSAVQYHQKVYSSTLEYNKTSKQIERILDPEETQYFGAPTPAIDKAWSDLLYGEFMSMTLEESSPYEPELTPLSDGQRHMELEVLHELHCLNLVRMRIDPDHYHDAPFEKQERKLPWSTPRDHLDHCLHLLMQSVLCHSDLTPVPMYSTDNLSHTLGRAGTHTCRDWSSIREWYLGRNAGGTAQREFEIVKPA